MSDHSLTDAARTERIQREVTAAGERLVERHPWLCHQDLIGFVFQIGAVAGMVLCAWAYLAGALAWWLTIPLVAIFASITHEMEHDLIHRMYFRNNPLIHNFLMLIGWMARPSTINPWIRRRLHLHHHKHSGTESDIEERGITNGEPWGVLRFLMLGDGILSVLIRLPRKPDWRSRGRTAFRALMAYFPLGWVHWGLWWVFLGFHAANVVAGLADSPIAWSQSTLTMMGWVNPLVVVLIAPNVLRSFCLHFISSNMHYFGNVEDRNFFQQTQVFNHPVFWPMQLFCFNFGSTHGIHHFVVPQTFYVRQWIARDAHRVMREQGVPFNDFGTFARANRRAV